MSAVILLAAAAAGCGCAAVATIVVPPTRRLAPRVRPYAVVARSALGLAPEPASAACSVGSGHAIPRVFGPVVRAVFERAGASSNRAVSTRSHTSFARPGWRTSRPTTTGCDR